MTGMEDTKKGLTINDRFTLQEYKGSGTFGEVWRATDSQKRKDVAIKIYISLNRQGCDEFLEEYKIASGLTHKNLLVTEQYDVWHSRPYLIMKYCAKGSAANLVGKLKPTMENERLLWSFIRDVSSGLAYLHNLEPDPIVHQDIKPDNVLVDSNGTFMITDFGISKKVRNTLRSQSKRAVEAGATAYMGPERFSKQPAPILASDIWSLGASIYELAEGELPFSGMGGIMLKNGAEMPDLNGWSDDLNNIMHRCLEKEPWKRVKAHEIEEIAMERVAYYNVHLKDYPSGSTIDPRATQRQASSSINGTVKKDSPKPEIRKPESIKPNNSLKGVWYSVAAIAACLIIYFSFFHESAELKDAKLHNEAYTTLVSQCSQYIDQGDGNDTQSLLNAKQAYSKILKLENDYSTIQPDFYNKAGGLKNVLDPKLEEAANAWAEAAKTQIDNLGDYTKAIEFYRLALSLWSSESIKSSYDNAKKSCAYMYIKSCDFSNENENGKEIEKFGATLHADKMRYLTPRIHYDGLTDSYVEKEIYIKILNPDGSVKSGTKSPNGYSWKETVGVSSGTDNSKELLGWGNGETSTYSRGIYTMELWHNKKRIYRTSIELK